MEAVRVIVNQIFNNKLDMVVHPEDVPSFSRHSPTRDVSTVVTDISVITPYWQDIEPDASSWEVVFAPGDIFCMSAWSDKEGSRGWIPESLQLIHRAERFTNVLGIVMVGNKSLSINAASPYNDGIFALPQTVLHGDSLLSGDVVTCTIVETTRRNITLKYTAVIVEKVHHLGNFQHPVIGEGIASLQDSIRLWRTLLAHEAVLQEGAVKGQTTSGTMVWGETALPRVIGWFTKDPNLSNVDKKGMPIAGTKVREGESVHLEFPLKPGMRPHKSPRRGQLPYYHCHAMVDNVAVDEHGKFHIKLIVHGNAALDLLAKSLCSNNISAIIRPIVDRDFNNRQQKFIQGWEAIVDGMDGPRKQAVMTMIGLQNAQYPPLVQVPQPKTAAALQVDALHYHPTTLQQKYAATIIEQEPPLTIIEGPPGTGKTRLIISMAQALVKVKPDSVILICAPSNKAADYAASLMDRLQIEEDSPIIMLRVYAPTIEVRHHQPYALHTVAFQQLPGESEYMTELREQYSEKEVELNEFPAFHDLPDGNAIQCQLQKMQEINGQMNDIKQTLMKAVLLELQPNIVITTCSDAADDRLQGLTVTHVMGDEIGQSTVVEAISAVSQLNLRKGIQAILVGDRFQLTPTISSSGVAGVILKQCIMHHIEDGGHLLKLRLKDSYRMHSTLLHHPNNYTYDGELESKVDDQQRTIALQVFPFPHKDHPLFFWSTDSGDIQPEGEFSRINEKEARIVANIMKYLKHKRVPLESIGVLTFYEAQRRLLVKHLSPLGVPPVLDDGRLMIANVDSFQGQEREIIIISCVRSNSEEEERRAVGFLSFPNRLNVALTRARSGLILVGDSTTLETNEHWSALVQHCEENRLLLHDNNEEALDKYWSTTDWYQPSGILHEMKP